MSNTQQTEKLASTILANPNTVWSILLRNGQELLSKIAVHRVDQQQPPTFVLLRARLMEHISFPVQGPQGIGINSLVKTRPLMVTPLGGCDEMPLFAQDIWVLKESSKESNDNYTRDTSGIVLT